MLIFLTVNALVSQLQGGYSVLGDETTWASNGFCAPLQANGHVPRAFTVGWAEPWCWMDSPHVPLWISPACVSLWGHRLVLNQTESAPGQKNNTETPQTELSDAMPRVQEGCGYECRWG